MIKIKNLFSLYVNIASATGRKIVDVPLFMYNPILLTTSLISRSDKSRHFSPAKYAPYVLSTLARYLDIELEPEKKKQL